MIPSPPALCRPDQDVTSCVPADRLRIYCRPIVVPHKHGGRTTKSGKWPAREWPAWTDSERWSLVPEDPNLWPAWTDERWRSNGRAVAR
jgi:hypothetical protein